MNIEPRRSSKMPEPSIASTSPLMKPHRRGAALDRQQRKPLATRHGRTKRVVFEETTHDPDISVGGKHDAQWRHRPGLGVFRLLTVIRWTENSSATGNSAWFLVILAHQPTKRCEVTKQKQG